MVKTRESSESEQVAIKHLRFAGLSYAVIERQLGCSRSAAFKVVKTLKQQALWRRKKKKILKRRPSCVSNC